ncbi:hypothetical protein OG229_34095 [Streptomyces platensis]|uniref:hypothetical protein n=2 Tax=Streptomyces platensis TaxID=58346 RepID=UPI002E125BE0|nr:hypothetical protein OG229_34095 [Streptomyces platensis]
MGPAIPPLLLQAAGCFVVPACRCPGPKGQSYVAAPQLPAYDRPPASDVTVVRRDGTQETRPALAPRLSLGSYDPARVKPQRSEEKCGSCDGVFKEGQKKQRLNGRLRHLPGECGSFKAVQPVQPRPTGREVPLHEKVARRFWIRRRCPVCGSKAGQDCIDPGEQGGEAVQREHGHDERIMPIVEEREAAAKTKKGQCAEDQRTGRGTASMVPAYKLMNVSCPVCHARPDAECALPASSHQARRDLLSRRLSGNGGRRRR